MKYGGKVCQMLPVGPCCGGQGILVNISLPFCSKVGEKIQGLNCKFHAQLVHICLLTADKISQIIQIHRAHIYVFNF